MKWVVEDIGVHANILKYDPDKLIEDYEPIGLGFPLNLAERIVKMHNEALETQAKEMELLISKLGQIPRTL